MIKREWKNIFHNAWIMVVMVAIILIPSIYACVFLGSMWDPYGNTGSIPVAVVNNDKEVTYNDSTLAVGEELVKNLKDNDAMDFHFVNKEDADKGLEAGDYYMVITIPSNFSENATTLLDEKPKKMILNYTTNPGTNYIASKMDDSAVTKIKNEVSASVTKTYAETIFDQVGTLTDGLGEASDGTQQLSDGVGQLVDGNKTITDNLKVLASSSLTFKDGANTLTKGLETYTAGVSTVDNGVSALKAGVGQLSSATPTLQAGIGQLNDGASSLKSGIGDYTDGVSQAYAGTQKLIANNTTLVGGVNQLNAGAQQLVAGNQQVVDGLTTVSNSLKASLSATKQAALTEATSADDQLVTLTNLMAGLLADSSTEQLGKNWLNGSLSSSDAETVATIATAGMDQTTQAAYKPKLVALFTSCSYPTFVSNVATGNKTAITELQAGVQQLNVAVNGGEITNADGSKTTTAGLLAGSQTVQAGLTSVNTATQSLQAGVTAYTDGVEQVNTGLATLSSNNEKLNSGAAALASGTGSLAEQTPTLVSGIKALDSGVSQLYAGTQQLVANNSTLVSGSTQLSDGAGQIASGSGQLAAGSTTLGDGLNTVADGVDTLNTSLKDGVEKAQMDTNDDTYDMIATPVDTTHDEVSVVENNGHAMAPYMMSVALYVAALAFTLMYPMRHGIKEAKDGFKYWASKATVMYIVSTVAAVVLISALRLINGFDPQQLVMTYVFAIITSAAFMSLVALLSLTTGYIGDFILLVFMIINLGGSAGTYPLETSGALYKIIHPFVPYTYTVNGFRKVISMATASVSTELLVLIGIFVVSTILTIVYFQVKNKEDKHLIPGAFEAVNEVEH